MLLDIKRFIQEREIVELSELAIHFKCDKTALRKMLELLEKKGEIKIVSEKSCAGCSACSTCNCDAKIYLHSINIAHTEGTKNPIYN